MDYNVAANTDEKFTTIKLTDVHQSNFVKKLSHISKNTIS